MGHGAIQATAGIYIKAGKENRITTHFPVVTGGQAGHLAEGLVLHPLVLATLLMPLDLLSMVERRLMARPTLLGCPESHEYSGEG